MNATNPTRTAGQIGRYEVSIATEAQRLSPYQISKGVVAQVGVWLTEGGRTVWGGTVARIVADPTCAASMLSATECAELAAMVIV